MFCPFCSVFCCVLRESLLDGALFQRDRDGLFGLSLVLLRDHTLAGGPWNALDGQVKWSQGCDGGSGVTGMMPTGGGDLTTVRLPRLLKGTGGYLGWYLAYLRMLYQVPPRTKLNHEVGGAIHTSEVAVNGRSASPWAAAGTAAARVRSSKVYGLRSKGILLAKEGNGDLSEVSGEHHKAWRMC